VTAVIFTILIFDSEFIANRLKFTNDFYTKHGFSSARGLAMEKVTLTPIDSDDPNEKSVLLAGKISNYSEQERHLPYIKFTLLDANRNKISSDAFSLGDNLLKPGEEFVLNNKLTRLNKASTYIVVDIGNRLELYFR
jgi:hypothetical protein